jgi:hypothetical protein
MLYKGQTAVICNLILNRPGENLIKSRRGFLKLINEYVMINEIINENVKIVKM